MQNKQKAIGILGGTFDPIHFGHLRAAVELHQLLNLAEVRLIPCFQPVHKNMPIASPIDRLEMTRIAIAEEPGLTVDDREIHRQGPSYMFDTLQSLRAENPTTPLCLILGIDALLGFPTWHRSEEILEIAHLVVAHRPQYDLPKSGVIHDLLTQRLSQDIDVIQQSLAGKILLTAITPLEISATDIRNMLMTGKSPRYLLPNSVYKYIKEHGIYGIS